MRLGAFVKSKAQRKNFGKRRVTRWPPWLALIGQPAVRLGALVFRLGQIRKSHSGLAPIRSDQDPDSRSCDRFNHLATPAGRTFSCEKLSMCSGQATIMGTSDGPGHGWEKGFLRQRRALKYSSLKEQRERPRWALPFVETTISSPSSELSLGRLLLSRACLCFTGRC